MTAESQIEAIINTIRESATANTTFARNQIDLTNKLLDAIKFIEANLKNYPGPARYGKFTPPPPPVLQTIPSITDPDLPPFSQFLSPTTPRDYVGDLGDIDDINTSDLFRHTAPGNILGFTGQIPNINLVDPLINIPDPTQIPGWLYDLLPLRTDFTVPSTQIPPYPTPSDPIKVDAAKDLDDRYITEFYNSLNNMRSRIGSIADSLVRQYFPNLENSITVLNTHFNTVVAGNKTVWTQRVEDPLFQRAEAKAEQEQQSLLRELNQFEKDRGAISLSGAFRTRYVDALMRSHDANVLAVNEIAQSTAEKEIRHLEYCLSSLMTTREQAIRALFEFHGQLLAEYTFSDKYAETVTNFVERAVDSAIKVAELVIRQEQFKQEAWRGAIEFVRFELEKLRAEIEIEKLKSDYNSDKISLIESLIRSDERLLSRAQLQLQIISEQNKNLLLPLDLFRAELEAYKAYVDSRDSQARIFETLMRGDTSILEARLTPLEIFKQKAQARNINIDGDRALLQAQVAYNEAVRTERQEQIETIKLVKEIEELRAKLGIDTNQQLLRQFESLLDAAKTEHDSNLRTWEQESTNIYRENQAALEQERNQTQLQLRQLDTIINASIENSRIFAGIATASIQALNGMVTLSNVTQQ